MFRAFICWISEFPEAMWHFRVKDFLAVVTMDSHGSSLHADVENVTGERLEELLLGAGR